MSSGLYNLGKKSILDGSVDLDSDTLKVMLVDSTYTFDPDAADLTALAAKEITVSGYANGFGQAGRKAATVAIQQDDSANQAQAVIDDLTWSALAAGVTIGGAVLVKEVTDDAHSIPIAFFDLDDLPTNGSDFKVDFAAAGAGGNIQW